MDNKEEVTIALGGGKDGFLFRMMKGLLVDSTYTVL